MDDNRTLTLVNGDRLRLGDGCALVFETGDLAGASPATVSRAGIVYVDPVDLGWQPCAAAWVTRTTRARAAAAARAGGDEAGGVDAAAAAAEATALTRLFDKYVPCLLPSAMAAAAEVDADAHEPVSSVGDVHAVTSLCSLLGALLAESVPSTAASAALTADVDGSNSDRNGAALERRFAFACVWALGGPLDVGGRVRFDAALRAVEPALFPPPGSVFDYSLATGGGAACEFRPWADHVVSQLSSSWRPPPPSAGVPLSRVLVPTTDTTRLGYVVRRLVVAGAHVLLTGGAGVGKTLLAAHELSALPTDAFCHLDLAMTAATTSGGLQRAVEAGMERRSKTKIGPPGSGSGSAGGIGGKRRMVVFLDDVSMPAVGAAATASATGTAAAVPPLELLRQWADYGGWYDRRKQTWRAVVDTQLLATAGTPSAGHPPLPERLASRFVELRVPPPSDATLCSLYESLLAPRWTAAGDSGFAGDVASLVPSLVAATVALFRSMGAAFRPTPAAVFHAVNTRDVGRVLTGAGLAGTSPTAVGCRDAALRLWVHEATRVFGDRLTTPADAARFRGLLDAALAEAVDGGITVSSLLQAGAGGGPDSGGNARNLLFADFCAPPPTATPSGDTAAPLVYREVTDVGGAFRSDVERALALQTPGGSDGDGGGAGLAAEPPVMFPDALGHVTRVARVLRTPGGHALLLGEGGVGRRTTARAAAWLTRDASGAPMSVAKGGGGGGGYSRSHFRDDLRRVFTAAGVRGTPTLLLLGDAQLADDGVAEDVSHVMSLCAGCGDGPWGLFTREDKAEAVEALRVVLSQPGLRSAGGRRRGGGDNDAGAAATATAGAAMSAASPDVDGLWARFLDRVRHNLHVVLALSPTAPGFRARLRRFPALLSCASAVDWVSPWSPGALREVAARRLLASPVPLPALPSLAPPSPPLALRVASSMVSSPAPLQRAASSLQLTAERGRAASLTLPPPPPEPADMATRLAAVMAAMHAAAVDAARRAQLSAASASSMAALSSVLLASPSEALAAAAAGPTAAPIHVTPAHFLEFTGGYGGLLGEKTSSLAAARDRLAGGLARLEEARVCVEGMQTDLAAKQEIVAASAAECDALLTRIVAERRTADERRAGVEESSARIDTEARRCTEIARDAEADLAGALPALERAVGEVDRLDAGSITEVKAYASPPDAVAQVLAAVMTLFGLPPDWATAKRKLGEADFLKQIKGFDKDAVAPATLKRLKRYTELPGFDADTVRRSSGAAAALCAWCRAVDLYCEVAREVGPKRLALRAAETALADRQAALVRAREQLADAVSAVAALNEQHAASAAHKAALQAEAERLADRLERAQRLVSGLAGERTRWAAAVAGYDASLATLPGDTLLAAAYLTYAGPFDGGQREALVAVWAAAVRGAGIPCSCGSAAAADAAAGSGSGGCDFDFTSFMLSGGGGGGSGDGGDGDGAGSGPDAVLSEWARQGLPPDGHSAANGVLITRASTTASSATRWPLLLDPHGQATRWLAARLARTGLRTCAASGGRELTRELEAALSQGLPLLLTGVVGEFGSTGTGGGVDACLEPLLAPSFVAAAVAGSHSSGGGHLVAALTVRVSGRDVPVAPGFRLFLSTRHAAPAVPPELSSRLSVVACGVTSDGLAEQLLATVVRAEEPRLEAQKGELAVTVAAGRAKLAELEGAVLRLLTGGGAGGGAPTTAAAGSLLEDASLVDALQASKATSEEVARALAVAEGTEVRIDAARSGYRPVSRRASLLYGVLADMACVDRMYAPPSLEAYTALFAASIADSRAATAKAAAAQTGFDDVTAPAAVLRARIGAINDWHTHAVYAYASRGLFTRHRLLLSLRIAVRRLEAEAAATQPHGGGHSSGGKQSSSQQQPAAALHPAVWTAVLHGPGGGNGTSAGSAAALSAAVAAATAPPTARRGSVTSAAVPTPLPLSAPLPPNPCAEWLPAEAWEGVRHLDTAVPPFAGLAASFEGGSSAREWQMWAASPCPERGDNPPLPPEWDAKCDEPMRLALLRVLRPDRLLQGVTRFVASQLGPRFVEPPPADVRTLAAASTPSTPLVLVVADAGSGVDPAADVAALAAAAAPGVPRLDVCALGQGQTARAARLIADARRDGGWVLLLNAHLVPAWLQQLERLAFTGGGGDAVAGASSAAPASSPHPSFRLWLTTAPHPAFPTSLLSRGLRLVCEPPRGLRANLARLYSGAAVTPAEFAARVGSGGPVPVVVGRSLYPRLLYGLAWFHSVLLERRHYGPLGWAAAASSSSYTDGGEPPSSTSQLDFGLHDFALAAELLADYLGCGASANGGGAAPTAALASATTPATAPATSKAKAEAGSTAATSSSKQPAAAVTATVHTAAAPSLASAAASVPWAALRAMVAEVAYSSRLTDDWDRRLAATLAASYLCEDAATTPGFRLAPGRDFFVPRDGGTLDDYRAFIASLPAHPSGPAHALGLHPNAEVQAARAAGRALLASAAALQARSPQPPAAPRPVGRSQSRQSSQRASSLSSSSTPSSAEGGGSPSLLSPAASEEARVSALAVELLRRLPSRFDVPAICRCMAAVAAPTAGGSDGGTTPAAAAVSPLSAVLLQEAAAYNRVLSAVRSSLAALLAGLDGSAPLAPASEAVAAALAAGVVPPSWGGGGAVPTRKPLSAWAADLAARVAHVAEWASTDGCQPPPSLWLGAFTRPGALLTAVLQTHARATGVRVDALEFTAAVLGGVRTHAELRELPRDGVLLAGLAVEGARWDGEAGCLTNEEPAAAAGPGSVVATSGGGVAHPMPLVHLRVRETGAAAEAAAASDAGGAAPATTFYRCPLYAGPQRSGDGSISAGSGTGPLPACLTSLDLPSGAAPPSFWVKRGAALLATW
jgi:hypothetical protein